MHTIRTLIVADLAATAAVRELLTDSHGFSSVRIPTIGDAVKAGIDPLAWYKTAVDFVANYPGNVAFTGGTLDDVEFFAKHGVTILRVTLDGVVQVSTGTQVGATRWTDTSKSSLQGKVASAVGLMNRIATWRSEQAQLAA
jgi:hypothetical protein